MKTWISLTTWVCWMAVLTSCGGGGGSYPKATFSFSVSSATLAEGAAPLSVQVVLHTSQAALSKVAQVEVFDRATGTATSGSDYTAFAPQLVTFPIGALDGDVQSVSLSVLDDLLVEGASETIKLGFQNPAGGQPQGKTMFTATVSDIHVATVQFSAGGSTTPDESGVPRSVAIELDLAPGVSLGLDVTARVSDANNGSATKNVDYANFPQQTLTFPSGSTDGVLLNVSVQVLDDTAIETDETVRLSLSNPGTGSQIGAASQHVMTIADDDATGAPALIATEGPTGVENALAYDALVDLGSQTVGAGPNAGTLVRIANAGGGPMDLGAPELAGSHPNDFSIEIESAPLAPPPGPGEAGFALAADSLAPLVALPPALQIDGRGIALATDAALLGELSARTRATLHGFPVPGLGSVTLDLHRLPLPIEPDAVLAVDGVPIAGGLRAVLGDLSLWSGSVLELQGSRAFLALSSGGSRGFLELAGLPDPIVHLSTERAAGPDSPALCRVVRGTELAALGFAEPELCDGVRLAPGNAPSAVDVADLPPPSDWLASANCEVAIETDWQLYQKFGSTPALTNYVTQLIAAVSDRYFVDVQTTLSIAYLGVHSSSNDGWTAQDSGGDTGDLLDEFVAAWSPSSWPVQANLAHFISGAGLGGGVAYLDVLCNSSFGFGVSANINGNINWGGWTGQPGSFTWDFVVVAHEIGHNFSSNHTHSYCPPLDLCYGNCNGTTSCSQGTLMSYCHTCGGMDNIDLVFHPVCADFMREAVNSSCLGMSALGAGDYVQYLVRFNPLTATGTRNADLRFSHDAPNATQPFKLRLRGTGN